MAGVGCRVVILSGRYGDARRRVIPFALGGSRRPVVELLVRLGMLLLVLPATCTVILGIGDARREREGAIIASPIRSAAGRTRGRGDMLVACERRLPVRGGARGPLVALAPLVARGLSIAL